MAYQPRITAAVANLMLDAGIGTLANSGYLRIYDGTQPAAGGGTATNLLAELTMNADAFPAASAGQLVANAITQDSSANMSGTATWFRLCQTDGTTLLDGAIGTAGSDLNLNSTTIALGGTVSCSSFTITHPLL